MELIDDCISGLAAKCWLLRAPSSRISLIEIDHNSAYSINSCRTNIWIDGLISCATNGDAIVVDKTILVSC